MRCIACGSKATTERPERTVQGYRRFRCRTCGKQFNERTGSLLNRTQYPSDVIALVMLWRLRYKLALQDRPKMFLIRGIALTISRRYTRHLGDVADRLGLKVGLDAAR